MQIGLKDTTEESAGEWQIPLTEMRNSPTLSENIGITLQILVPG